MATEILNISCAKLIGGPQEFLWATKIFILGISAGNCRKILKFCSLQTVEATSEMKVSSEQWIIIFF